MSPGTEPVGRQRALDCDVVAAIDEFDGEPHYIIADISRDESWLSIAEPDAEPLEAWR